MQDVLILLAMGLVAGVFSGFAGIGGGTILVPLLVYFFGFSQHSAQGSVLFMFLFPVGILGVIHYWQNGYVDWKTALTIASTFVIGAYFGSKIAVSMDKVTLQRVFGVIMLLLSIKMIWGK